ADAVLTWAAAAEQRQSHPIARAITQAAHERGLDLPAIDDAHYQIGYGIKVSLAGHTLRVGSERFMLQEQVHLPETLHDVQGACHDQGYSLVLVARDQELVGALELHPTLRPEAAMVVAQFKQRQFQIYLLSGDHAQPTRRMAEHLGIDHYIAEVLPQEKSAVVERLQQEGRKVCFVGDGINDAIALRQANLSVSLRGASTVATDTAQVVLMDASLQHLVGLFDLGDAYRDTMRSNLLLATVPGVVCIGGVFLLHWGLATAVLLSNVSLLGSMANVYLPLLWSDLKPRREPELTPGT
ncbi:MAG: HAD family hydrolase, partial [Chloroflexia bacterium]|nr:HAD family hydrolase [Chloroflexia bacterium]